MRQKEKHRYTSARERAEKQNVGFLANFLKLPEGVQLFKPKAGVMLLDILPFVAGKGNPWAEKGCLHWERTYYAHRGVGANGDTYVCPRMTSKKPCPICDFRSHLSKKGDEADEELIKDLAPKQRQLFNVINAKDPDKGVQIWDMSYFLFGKLLDARIRNSEEDDGWEKFFFLDEGMTLKIGFQEKSFGGYTFLEVETIDFKPRREPYDEEMLEQTHCLDDLLIEPSFDELKKAFLESDKKSEDDEEEEKDEAPPKKTAKAPHRKHEEEDEDEEQDDEEQEDTKPPKKSKPAPKEDEEDEEQEEGWQDHSKKKSKPAPKEDEEDEEDEDEDEPEEEDEPPKKSKPAPPSKKPQPEADDDEDDWDDFDDEEEDEKPAKKSSKKDEEEEEERPRKRK